MPSLPLGSKILRESLTCRRGCPCEAAQAGGSLKAGEEQDQESFVVALPIGALGLGSCSAVVAPVANSSGVMRSCSGYVAVPVILRVSSRSVLEYLGCNWCLGSAGWKELGIRGEEGRVCLLCCFN